MKQLGPMKYSIIIPHHNSPQSLIECINSIPCSPSFQIIVVDDCSDTNVVNFEEIRLAVDKKVKIVRLQENRGAGAARNEGLKYAKGDWILFADADDLFLTGMERLLNKATACTNSDVIFFNIDSRNNESLQGQIYRHFVDNYDGTEKTVYDLKYRSWCPWAKAYRRIFIENLGIKFEERKKGNDCYFVLNAVANAQQISVVKDSIYHLTYSPNSLSYSNMNNWNYMFDVYDLWLWRYRFFRDNNVGIWKEYNILYLLREVFSTFGLKKSMYIFFRSFRYRYNYIEFFFSKIRKRRNESTVDNK